MRLFFVALALAASAVGAAAQTEKLILSAAQRLDCLVKPGDPPRYPKRGELDRDSGAMRVLLKFSRPDAAPEVQMLYNVAREDMQDQVRSYLAGYRLPCLQPDDGAVTAVQDFTFDGSDKDPLAVPEAPSVSEPRCFVMPRRALDYGGNSKYRVDHVRVEATFRGDGDQPPEIRLVFARASSRFQEAVREWVAQYRMPCRKPQDKPVTMTQLFSYAPGQERFGLTRNRFPLMEFLGQTQAPGRLKARFDLRTMGCPFNVRYTLGGGAVSNDAQVVGPTDPNKVAFLHWLEGLQFNFGSKDVADDLFGSVLQVDVPCGLLDLKGEAG